MAVGWAFPKILDGNSVKLVAGIENVLDDLKLLFNSELYEYRYDPGYGSQVPLLKLRPKNRLTLDLLTDAITEAQLFIPNISFNRDSVEITYGKPGTVDIKIQALIDTNSYITELRISL